MCVYFMMNMVLSTLLCTISCIPPSNKKEYDTVHTKEQRKLMTCKTYTSRSILREQAWWLYYRLDVVQTGLRYRLCLLGTNSLMRDRDKAQDHQGGTVERIDNEAVLAGGDILFQTPSISSLEEEWVVCWCTLRPRTRNSYTHQ